MTRYSTSLRREMYPSILGMKNDMGGAAALLGSFYTLVKLGFKQNLHCLLCVADNTISHCAKYLLFPFQLLNYFGKLYLRCSYSV